MAPTPEDEESSRGLTTDVWDGVGDPIRIDIHAEAVEVRVLATGAV